jgi:tight adherence protein B
MAEGMLPIAVAGLAALAVLLIAVGVAMSGGSGGVSARLERYARSAGDRAAATTDRESMVSAGLTRLVERQGMTARLSTELARADLKLRPAEFVAAWIASPFLFVGGAVIMGFVIAGFRHPIALAVIFGIGAYFPRFYLKYRQGKRLKSFSDQLPDTITLLANSLRAGSSFLQGIELVTRESQPPISEEFERVVREMSLGVALQPALNNLVRRVASEDLELMVTAINIQSQVGGNLATVLDSIAYTIRERIRIQGEIKTLTAMQRYSGYVITLLPVGLAGILFLVSPSYISRMLQPEPSLFGLPAGIVFFLIGGLSMFFGYVLIRRIVDIKV